MRLRWAEDEAIPRTRCSDKISAEMVMKRCVLEQRVDLPFDYIALRHAFCRSDRGL